MTAFSAVTELIIRFIIMGFKSFLKIRTGLPDLFSDLREISEPERGSVFLNK
jgi:hypothetical protein